MNDRDVQLADLRALLRYQDGAAFDSAVAISARSVLEDAVGDFFGRCGWKPRMSRFGDFFRVLRTCGAVSIASANEMQLVWSRLSNSCHHRTSMLQPDRDEVSALVSRVALCVALLDSVDLVEVP